MLRLGCLLLTLQLLCHDCLAAHIRGGVVVPLYKKQSYSTRQGLPQRRLLLRNATLPLHGAVRDYGYVQSLSKI